MKRIAWPQLMEVGFRGLGLTPDVFWNLTPAEFLLLTGFREREALGRTGLEVLLARFPDLHPGACPDGADLE